MADGNEQGRAPPDAPAAGAGSPIGTQEVRSRRCILQCMCTADVRAVGLYGFSLYVSLCARANEAIVAGAQTNDIL